MEEIDTDKLKESLAKLEDSIKHTALNYDDILDLCKGMVLKLPQRGSKRYYFFKW